MSDTTISDQDQGIYKGPFYIPCQDVGNDSRKMRSLSYGRGIIRYWSVIAR